MNLEKLQKEWLTQEQSRVIGNKKYTNRKKKGQYLHFDKKITNFTTDKIASIWNPVEISKHSFFPFIRFIKEIKRYKKIPGTKKKDFKIKKRPIDYASHHDALIYSWYSHILLSFYELELKRRIINEVAIAYRNLAHKSNTEFANDIIEFIKKHPEYVVITFDVEKFFENLDHFRIKTQWSKLLSLSHLPDDHYRVFRSLTEYHYVDIEKLHKIFGFNHKDHSKKQQVCSSIEFRQQICDAGFLVKNKRLREENGKQYRVGIPQGTSLSCVISNLYMIDFDEVISLFVASIGGLYRRYSDDIIIIIPKDNVIIAEKKIKEEIEKINLTLNQDKTEKHHFVDKNGELICIDSNNQKVSPLQYLGIQFDGEESFLRHAGIAKFQRRRNQVIRNTIKKLKKNQHMPKKMYLQKFTHKGKENYLGYATRAQKALKNNKIERQVSKNRISKQLKNQIKKNISRYTKES